MASLSAAGSDEARERDAAIDPDAPDPTLNDNPEPPFQQSLFRTRVIPVFAIVMVVGLLGLLAYAMFAPEDARRAPQGRINSETGVLVYDELHDAPDFAVTSFAGEQLRMADLRGQIVVLNFWASWCPPCRNETPLLEAAQDNLGDDVALVGMDIWDAEGDARDFLEQYGVTYTVGHDDDGAVAIDYGVSGVPETFIIDAEGRVVARLPGEVKSLEQLRGMVAEAR